MKNYHKISNLEGSFMLAVAFAIDVAQALLALILVGLVINRVITIFAWLTFYVWFKIKRVSFINPKRMAALNIAGIVESIPFLGALPGWTIAVIIILATLRVEEATGLSLTKPIGK